MTPAAYRPGFFLAIDNNHGKALDIALTDLTVTLTEAREYLYSPDYPLAAIGTLTSFTDQADDVKAALRLYTNAIRRKP